MMKRAGEQEAVVGFRGKNVFATGKIAEVSWFRLRIDIDAVSSSQVVAVPVTVDVPVDLQDVSSDCGPMPLKESIDVISIERSAPIPAVAI